ncbi:MAG: DUF692 domain-containing protein [Sphingomonadales bacterium]|nr:DUF692 domain-containing protein [Sphingomonadales bacterium]
MTHTPTHTLQGAGLGFRRELFDEMDAGLPPCLSFFEIAPENWMGLGGRWRERFNFFLERYPFVCHGLSLSLGGPNPLDVDFLSTLKTFMDDHQIALYTEHLSYSTDEGQLYDLMPIPRTMGAVKYVADRIQQTQDVLGRRIGVENVSYYVDPAVGDMSEADFIAEVIAMADCHLHLDVNNVYVNSVNHGYDPVEFMNALPADRVVYMHMAGHDQRAPDLIIDTHGEDVIPKVWDLLDVAYQRFGVVPTLLERDFNFPNFKSLIKEVAMIEHHQAEELNRTPQTLMTPTSMKAEI